MQAPKSIRLATGRDSIPGSMSQFELMTAGVLVIAWWAVVKSTAVLVFDEAHIRSFAYTELAR
jgi:hypothetical protein